MITSALLKNKLTPIKIKYTHKLFVLCLLASILNGYFWGFLNELYFHYAAKPRIQDAGKGVEFIFAIILAPCGETFLCNFFPNLVLRAFTTRFYILLIVPSILFAFNHTYNPLYVVYTFFGGIILNYFYLKSREVEQSTIPALIWTCLLHASFNFFVFLTS